MSFIDDLFTPSTIQILDDEALRLNFYNLFIENIQSGIDMMNAAADLNDAEAMRKAAHLLKGTTSFMKRDKMHCIASQTETSASNGDMDKAIELSRTFIAEFNALKASAKDE